MSSGTFFIGRHPDKHPPTAAEIQALVDQLVVTVNSKWRHKKSLQEALVVEIRDSRMGKMVHYREDKDGRSRQMCMSTFQMRWQLVC